MRKLLLITLSVITYATTFAQNITTIAGGGIGDGGPAINIPINYPVGTVVDGSGNIYIADRELHRIRKVTASTGIISTVAGNGTGGYGGDSSAATSAKLNYPEGVAVDVSGNIYIADRNNHRIRKVTVSTGIISTVVGNGYPGNFGNGSAATSASLNLPSGVAVDGSGNIYIADAGNNRIRKVTASTGIITSVAGNGTAGYGGDGSAATLANLNQPIGLAVDFLGNIYIADYYNHRIRKVTASTGIISTVAGFGIAGYVGDGSAATSARLHYPSGVVVDDSGNIYIADYYNHRIRKVNASTGIISTVAGNGIQNYRGDGSAATSANLAEPTGIALDGLGNIYIADNGNNSIRKVTASTGIISTVAGNGTVAYGGDGSAATSANLYGPNGVTLDGSGNIYITDAGNNRIRKVTASTGIISTVAGNGFGIYGYGGDGITATSASLYYPRGIALDSSGNVYIADYSNQRIRKVTASTGIISTVAGNGTQAYVSDGSAATSAYLYNPSGVAVDGFGNIYISDNGNYRIRKVTASTGIISTVAGNGQYGYGGDGGAATATKLSNPTAVALDVFGNIYIADYYNQRIRKVTASTGIISTVAGNGTKGDGGDGSAATSANLNYPTGVALDGSGNIYIADNGNNRIRKVTASTGIISTIAGNGTQGFGGDDSAATSANLNSPRGVAVDSLGNIYIADAGNSRIRKVSNLIINNIISNSQTICTGSASVSLSGSTPIGATGSFTYTWLSSNTSATAGFTAIPSSNTINYSPGALSQSKWFRRYVVSGAYTDTSAAVAITITNAIANNTITGTAQTICSGSIPAPITATIASGGNGTTYNYKWLKSTTNATTGYASAGGNDSTQNLISNALIQNTWFKRKVTSGVCNADTTAALLVTVIPAIATNTITGSTQTICSGNIPATITATTATGGNGTNYTYKWLKSTTSATTGYAIAGGNDSTQNFISNALTQNTWFKRKVTSGNCTDTTAALLVTVNNAIATNTITGTAQTICSGLIPAPIVATAATGGNGSTYNYKWLKSTTSATTGFTNAGGNDSIKNFTSIALTQNTWFKRKVISGVCNADTTAALLVTIKPTSVSTTIISICPNLLPFIWNGRTYNSNRTDSVYLTNAVGCDSVTILKLTIKPTSTSTSIISICPSSLPYTWNGRSYNTNRTDTVYLTNSLGCDSITILKLTVKSTSTSTNNINICSSALPYTWNGRTYNSNRTDTVILTNSVGCDSITILKLTVKPTSSSTSNISICPSALPYTWNGRTYNVNKTDTVYLTNSFGCDSVIILKLTVKSTSTSSNNLIVCPSALPYTWNGLIFNAAGTQTKTGLINSVGCDSTATLTLTVKPTSTSINNISICPSALPYTWNGLIFNVAGTKTKTGLTNSVGCDSSATLNLTVKTTSTSTNNISICPGSLPYTWNNLIFNTAGTQTKTGLINSVGCDSSATLNLTVNPSPNTSNIVGLANAAKLDTASYSVSGLSGSVFNWIVSGATIQSGAGSNKIQVKWLTTGIDTIKVTETSNQGCIGTQKSLIVNVTPGTGMNELKANNQVIIYPNPFSETIHITLLNNLKLEKAIIYDLVGNEIIISNKNEIDASSLKAGVYLIMIVDNIGNCYSQKLVKN